ncbi:MAG TPA: penicillin-binding transpeptidase domain-containing protein [Halanaerobiales bacterium]|nr:penicillin-binding transpeptidase domain-containing protein [Halanaerobiales bacterium]
MVNKKNLIIAIIILSVLLIGGASYVVFVPDPVESANEYLKALENNNYEKAYSLLAEESKEKITIETMKNRYENFYKKAKIKGKQSENLIVQRDDFFSASANYRMNFNSADFGKKIYEYTMNLKRESLINWKIKWNYNLIFPDMTEESKFVREVILPERGVIFDRNKNPLAVKGEVVEVGIQAAKVENQKILIEELTQIMDVDESEIMNSLQRYPDNPEWFSPLKTLTWENYKKLEEKLRPISGVFFRKKESRVYPYKEITAHLTGYISEISNKEIESSEEINYISGELTGKSGLEKSYEKKLRGKNGYILYLQNNNNKKELMRKKAVDGENLITSIDRDLQKKVWQALDNKTGAVVVSDPKNGEILAMVSSPSYDPNQFVLGMSQSDWEKIQKNEKSPMLNRAIQGLYPPGSTFKIITAASALDSGLVEMDTEFNDKGELKIEGNIVRNYQNEVFGKHTFKEALTYSINTAFAKIALELSKERLIEYINKFGFEKNINLGLEVKNSSIGEINSKVDLAWTGLGQAKVLTNPIQMNRIIAIVANQGKNVFPSLIKNNLENEDLRQIIAKENINKLEEMLINVVDKGTGKNADLESIEIAGKTGTAEIGIDDEKPHAWFVGYAPVNNPELAVAVFLENGGVGGKDAAPIFKKIISDLANEGE